MDATEDAHTRDPKSQIEFIAARACTPPPNPIAPSPCMYTAHRQVSLVPAAAAVGARSASFEYANGRFCLPQESTFSYASRVLPR